MSSILNALKRLEHEKASRKPDSFNIDAEILKSSSSRRTSSVGVIFAACAVFACGSFAAYLYLKNTMPPASVISTSPAPKHEIRAETKIVTEIPSEQPVILPSDQNNMAQPKVAAPVTVKTMPPLQPTVQLHQSQAVKSAETIPQSLKQTVDPKPLPSSTPSVNPPAKPTALKLDGIAFQDGGVDSLAVINGTTVSKGSMIEGAKVEEVLKDRVRFSRGVDKFEIILDKTN
jgi:general secretion pathway protein B